MESESGRVLMLISPSAHISFLPTGMPGLVFEGIAFRTYSLNGDTINEAEVSPWSTGRVGAYYNEDTPTTWNIIVSFDKGGEWSGQVDLAKSPLDLKKTIDRQAQTSLIDQSQAQDTSTLDDSLTTTSTPTAATTSLPLASVIAETVNLRAGPGTNYQVVGEARSGETLPITGRSATGDWWQVVAPDGQTAWVNAGLVEASGAERVTQVEAPPPPTANPAASGGLWVLVADSAADFPGPIQNRKWYYHWSEGRNNFIWQDMTQGPECYHAPNEMTLEICQDRMQVDTCEGNELAWRDCSRGDAALLWKAIEGGTYRFEWSANEVDGESSIWFYKHLDRVYEIGPGSELPYSATIEGVIQWELFFFIPQYDTKYQVKVYRLQP